MIDLMGEEKMMAFAAQCASVFENAALEGGLIFLEGDLGAGKTTFSRGLMRGFNYAEPVKSPTYTLVETYDVFTVQKDIDQGFQPQSLTVCHFDLYRVADPEELEFMGIRDYLEGAHLCLMEWADKGAGFLPVADLVISIADIKNGRQVRWKSGTEKGQAWCQKLNLIEV